MKKNSLIKYKKNIFKTIIIFFKSKFKSYKDKNIIENSNKVKNRKLHFNEAIKIDDLAQERNELLNLKILYDNEKITDEDLDIYHIYKLIDLYNDEIKKIKEDTKQRMNNIEINMS